MRKKPDVHLPNRPNWEEKESYPDHLNWSFSNWAWEFLRRNEEFQHQCLAAERATAKTQLQVANRFGLQELKDFRENFHAGAVPEWLCVLPGVLTRATGKDSTLKERAIPHGQVVLTFDLNAMFANRPNLDAQVYNAGSYLSSCLEEYALLKGSAPRSPRPHKGKLFKYLRVYDATNYAGIDVDAEIAAVLYPDQMGAANHYSGEAKVKHHRKVAARMVISGYLELPAKDYQKIRKTKRVRS